MPHRFLVILLTLAFQASLFVAPTSAQTSQDSGLSRVAKNLAKEQSQAQHALEREREILRGVERNAGQQLISASQLEQSRLDITSLQSQRSSITNRLLSRREGLRDLRADMERISERLTNKTASTDTAALQSSLTELKRQHEGLEQVEESLRGLQRLIDNRLSVARQKLSVLQSRFELPELSAMTRPPSSQERQLRSEVDKLLAEASDLRFNASAAAEKLTELRASSVTMLNTTPNPELAELSDQQSWLATQAQAAEERAELRQLSLKRLRAEQIIRVLGSFPNTQSTPLRVLRSGNDNMEELTDDLIAQQEAMERRLSILSDQQKLADAKSDLANALPNDSARSELIRGLERETREQLTALNAVLDQAKTISDNYKTVIADSSQTELLQRNNWPADRYAWQSLATNLAKLPGRVVRDYLGAVRKLVGAVKRMLNGENMLAVFTAFGILVLGIVGFWFLRRWERNQEADKEALKMGRSLKEPLRILRRNYFLLMLPLLMAVMGWQLGLSVKSLTLLVTPLLIWPTVTVGIAFMRYFLRTYTPDINREETTKLVRLAGWVIAFTAILAGFLVVARTVALSPLVTSTIEGLSMICLLVIALPLIKLRHSLLGNKRELFATGEASDKADRQRRWLSLGSGVLVFALIASALVGLAGYTTLAWSIASYIGWAVLVGLGWLMARSLIREFIDSWNARIVKRDVDTAAFWRQCVLAPLYGVLVIALTVLAGFLLYWLYGWDAETPIVQAMPKVFNYTLFKVGDTEIELSNFLIAGLIVFMVFRAANWSRQVSYRFALQKVQDVGIRNSLSTFVQYTVVVAGLMVAMRTIGLDLTALTVFAGALGVGIGFGLQQIVVNFISGILLLIERPLRTTDLVNVDKYEGEVTHIGIRSLTVKTWDAQEVVIPNSAVITKPFTNWTRSDDTMRTVLMVGISYNDDPSDAIKLIEDICKAHPAVLKAPAPKVLLWEYADSALLIRIQLFSHIRGAIGRVDMRSQLLLSIHKGLKDAGMSIPFPQRDVHLIKQTD